ncbi:fluoride efflux transporter FluC [Serinibacter salmoneus]|uniref:Fluoride-specific ion channel FluC n=1 Tax=Serinibacter salmoneus TaxID=556530 RepID=A0A2A9CXQ5_9MICO|nr:CrcB family protein [Serinibacter salmoneus]PFG18795.1 camphor resistance protein CrcB [Serinibacter salmoneus]
MVVAERPHPLIALALVGAGGAAGASARYLITALVPAGGLQILPTLAINLVGSYLLGFLNGHLNLRPGRRAAHLRLLLGTGMLGGFTTYSAFALQVVTAGAEGSWRRAIMYAGASVLLGVGAAALGLVQGGRFATARDARRAGSTGPGGPERGTAS